MAQDSEFADVDAASGKSGQRRRDATILLFMEPGRDRELLVDTLGERYEITTTTDVETLDSGFDCCIFDTTQFHRVTGTVQWRRQAADSVFLPFVLLVGERSAEDAVEAWEYVDDVIKLPVKKRALHARIGNLVERRQTAVRLAEREEQLERTVEDLKLKERAMDEAPVGITIAEPGEGDNPLVYANEKFETLTGYDANIVGDDCRFLQGEETDPETKATMREAIDAEEPVSVDVLNYRKNGEKFWNKLDIAPLRDDEGAVTNYVGFQSDITDRKIRERRMEVMNRVLNHNLRNKMNVIQGYVTLLQRSFDGDPPSELAEIERATGDLLGLAEAVQKIERTLDAADATETVIDLCEQTEQLVSAFKDQYPDAQFDVTLPESETCEVAIVGLMTAIEEAIENAIKHNESDEPWVEIGIDNRPDDWVDIRISDDGPGIPDQELKVLQEGETPLQHADRLGLWLMYWVVSKAGGDFSVSEGDRGGTSVAFSIPSRG